MCLMSIGEYSTVHSLPFSYAEPIFSVRFVMIENANKICF